MTRSKNRGLDYFRRSTGKQEISLPNQLKWAIEAAQQQGVEVAASLADLTHMQTLRLFTFKDIRLDDGISGSDLSRPGFLAFNRDALADRSVSHVFFYKRDRFARPEDAMQAALIEKKLLLAGITVVHSDGVTLPLRHGEQNILRDMELLLGYYQSGEELRKHAERVLGFQQALAENGYRTGGNTPYGFVRVLVDAAGNVLEELPRGKTVRQEGCHVRIMPKDLARIATWLQILEWKSHGLGYKRIANKLNDLGIPSPDAGNTRTDHGVRHLVSGKWNTNTIADLCQNMAILGIQDYGKRSEGKLRRRGKDGPRLLEEEKDLTSQGRLRTIINDPSLRVQRKVGEAKFDPVNWQAVQSQIEERGRNQRGIPRAKDPARYPLACRIVDLTDGCGSIMYGRTNQKRSVYTCGRYMRTSGAECASNQVDAEAMLRLVLKTLKQFVDLYGRRDKLRQKLLDRARAEVNYAVVDQREVDITTLQARRTALASELNAIEYRMARERDDTLYVALSRQYQSAQADLAAVEEAARRAQADMTTMDSQSPEIQVDGALALLDNIARITGESHARAEINPLLKQLGLWIGLSFRPFVKGKKRVVQILISGKMVFGDNRLPVPLFGNANVLAKQHNCAGALHTQDPAGKSVTDHDRRSSDELAPPTGASKAADSDVRQKKQIAGSGMVPDRLNVSQPEGISITKGNRGERI